MKTGLYVFLIFILSLMGCESIEYAIIENSTEKDIELIFYTDTCELKPTTNTQHINDTIPCILRIGHLKYTKLLSPTVDEQDHKTPDFKYRQNGISTLLLKPEESIKIPGGMNEHFDFTVFKKIEIKFPDGGMLSADSNGIKYLFTEFEGRGMPVHKYIYTIKDFKK